MQTGGDDPEVCTEVFHPERRQEKTLPSEPCRFAGAGFLKVH